MGQEQKVEKRKEYYSLCTWYESSLEYRLGELVIDAMKHPIRLAGLPFRMYKAWKNPNKKCEEICAVDRNVIEFHDFKAVKAALLKAEQERISIVIPVYNACSVFRECIQSIMENTIVPYQILVVNDSSTEKELLDYLNTLKENKNVTIINNEQNRGFVHSVNVGLQACKSDAVLLNSDTIVTPRWLYKLMVAAYSAQDIMTVTPVSNAAGAFSVPKMCQANEVPEGYSIQDMAQIVERQQGGCYEAVPTGNGFCMYVKRKAVEMVGLLDEETYGRGYCEENDFCMRLYREGYRNIVCGNTYIFHKCSVSFKKEKQKLLKQHLKILYGKYPEYRYLVEKAFNSAKMHQMRNDIQQRITEWKEYRDITERILYVCEAGEQITAKDAVFVLNILSDRIELCQRKEDFFNIIQIFDDEEEWENIFFSVCYQLRIDKLCIHRSNRYMQTALEVAKWLQIHVEELELV